METGAVHIDLVTLLIKKGRKEVIKNLKEHGKVWSYNPDTKVILCQGTLVGTPTIENNKVVGWTSIGHIPSRIKERVNKFIQRGNDAITAGE